MKLSDKIISATIKYQTACSIYQQAPYDPWSDQLYSNCQRAFNNLVELAEQADIVVEDYKRISQEIL